MEVCILAVITIIFMPGTLISGIRDKLPHHAAARSRRLLLARDRFDGGVAALLDGIFWRRNWLRSQE